MQQMQNTQQRVQSAQKLERALLQQYQDERILSIIANPQHKDTPKHLKELVLEIAEKTPTIKSSTIKPKILSILANTLLITKHCGSKHNDIDQPHPAPEATALREKSTKCCTCQPREENSQPNTPSTVPEPFCSQCKLTMAIPDQSTNNNTCPACSEKCKNTLHQGHCSTACQSRWLLTQNSTEARFQIAQTKLNSSTIDSTTTKAGKSLQLTKRITDPTIIPKGTKTNSNKPKEILDEMIKKKKLKVREEQPLAEKLSAHWKRHNVVDLTVPLTTTIKKKEKQPDRKSEHIRLRQPYRWLGSDALQEVTHTILQHLKLRCITSYFFPWCKGNNWRSSRQYFLPETTGAWEPMPNATPINSLRPVILPINCKLNGSRINNHWIMAARYPTTPGSRTDWTIVLVDSFNDEAALTNAQYTIRYRTTLHLAQGHMDVDEPCAASAIPSTHFINHPTIDQTEEECGFRMMLHMAVAGKCNNATQFMNAIDKIRPIPNLAQKCRNWACDILAQPQNTNCLPKWITDLTDE